MVQGGGGVSAGSDEGWIPAVVAKTVFSRGREVSARRLESRARLHAFSGTGCGDVYLHHMCENLHHDVTKN